MDQRKAPTTPDRNDIILGLSKFNDSSVLLALVERLAMQTSKGVQKYGSPVQASDMSPEKWIEHLQDELTDALVYLECLKQSLRSTRNENNG